MKHPDLRLEIRTDPQLLQSVRTVVRSYLTSLDVPEERAADVVLAVDEACTNSIRHSYEGADDCFIQLTLGASDDWIEVELSDEGRPASRESIEPKPVDEKTRETVQPGGLGVQLIYEVFDDVRFEPGECCGNRVVMRLQRPTAVDSKTEA